MVRIPQLSWLTNDVHLTSIIADFSIVFLQAPNLIWRYTGTFDCLKLENVVRPKKDEWIRAGAEYLFFALSVFIGVRAVTPC